MSDPHPKLAEGLEALEERDYARAADCWRQVLIDQPGHQRARQLLDELESLIGSPTPWDPAEERNRWQSELEDLREELELTRESRNDLLIEVARLHRRYQQREAKLLRIRDARELALREQLTRTAAPIQAPAADPAIAILNAQLDETREQLAQLNRLLDDERLQAQQTRQELDRIRAELVSTRAEATQARAEAASTRQELEQARTELELAQLGQDDERRARETAEQDARQLRSDLAGLRHRQLQQAIAARLTSPRSTVDSVLVAELRETLATTRLQLQDAETRRVRAAMMSAAPRPNASNQPEIRPDDQIILRLQNQLVRAQIGARLLLAERDRTQRQLLSVLEEARVEGLLSSPAAPDSAGTETPFLQDRQPPASAPDAFLAEETHFVQPERPFDDAEPLLSDAEVDETPDAPLNLDSGLALDTPPATRQADPAARLLDRPADHAPGTFVTGDTTSTAEGRRAAIDLESGFLTDRAAPVRSIDLEPGFLTDGEEQPRELPPILDDLIEIPEGFEGLLHPDDDPIFQEHEAPSGDGLGASPEAHPVALHATAEPGQPEESEEPEEVQRSSRTLPMIIPEGHFTAVDRQEHDAETVPGSEDEPARTSRPSPYDDLDATLDAAFASPKREQDTHTSLPSVTVAAEEPSQPEEPSREPTTQRTVGLPDPADRDAAPSREPTTQRTHGVTETAAGDQGTSSAHEDKAPHRTSPPPPPPPRQRITAASKAPPTLNLEPTQEQPPIPDEGFELPPDSWHETQLEARSAGSALESLLDDTPEPPRLITGIMPALPDIDLLDDVTIRIPPEALEENLDMVPARDPEFSGEIENPLARYLLTHIDGTSSFRELMVIVGLPKQAALEGFRRLLEANAIRSRRP